MSFPFTLKPTRWWDYLNPFWWQKKRIVEKVMNYTWDAHGLEEKINEALKDAIRYGKGKIPMDWVPKDSHRGD